jgi:hypothetical protein
MSIQINTPKYFEESPVVKRHPSDRLIAHQDLVKFGEDQSKRSSNPSPNNINLVPSITTCNNPRVLNIITLSPIIVSRIQDGITFEITVNKNDGAIISSNKKGFEDILMLGSLESISIKKISINELSYWTTKNVFVPAKN